MATPSTAEIELRNSTVGAQPTLDVMLVQPVMVEETHQGGIGQIGRAAARKRDQMVGFGPGGRSVAAGHGAAAVAKDERRALRRGEESLGGAHIEHPRGAAEHGRYEAGAAGEATSLTGADALTVGQVADSLEVAGQGIDVERDDHGGRDAPVDGQIGQAAGEVSEAQALPVGAGEQRSAGRPRTLSLR